MAESLPVSEDIKKQKGAFREHIANYKTSLQHLAESGKEVVCYKLHAGAGLDPTDLRWTVANGASCMRFDIYDFAAFDIHILRRPNAAADFTPEVAAEAERRAVGMSEEAKRALARNVTMGLPGSTESMTLEERAGASVRIWRHQRRPLRQHFIDFLEEVVPVAEDVASASAAIRTIRHSRCWAAAHHVDRGDYARMLKAVDSPANGMTLCSGSLGARPDNDLPA